MAGRLYGAGFGVRDGKRDAPSGPGRAAFVLKAAFLSAVGILGLGLGCVPPQPMVKSDAPAPEPSAVATLAPSPTEAVTPEASPAVTPTQAPIVRRVRPRIRSLAGERIYVSGASAAASQEPPRPQVWTPTPISFPVHLQKAATAESGFPWAAWLIGFGVVLAGLGMVGAIAARRPKIRPVLPEEAEETPLAGPRESEPEETRVAAVTPATGETSAPIPEFPVFRTVETSNAEQAAVSAAPGTGERKTPLRKTVKSAGSVKRRPAVSKKTARKASIPSNVVPLKKGRKKSAVRGKLGSFPAKKRVEG